MSDNPYRPDAVRSLLLREAGAIWSHYHGHPYPLWGFANIRDSVEGQFPTALPVTKKIVNSITDNLWANPPELTSSEFSDKEMAYLTKIFELAMPKIIKARTVAGIFGESLLWISNADRKDEVRFEVRDPRDYFIIYADHERTQIEKVFFHYPFQTSDGKWFWRNEVWSKDEIIRYKNIPADPNFNEAGMSAYAMNSLSGFLYGQTFDSLYTAGLDKLEIDRKTDNLLGFIPGVLVINEDTINPLDRGDLHNLRPIIRRVDLVYHLMDRNNQRNGKVITALINAVDAEGEEGQIDLGDQVSINSVVDPDTGEIMQADIRLLEARGAAVGYMERYADDLRAMLYEVCNVVVPRMDDVTNKGNMTPAVFQQMYQPITAGLNKLRLVHGNAVLEFLIKAFLALKGKPEKASDSSLSEIISYGRIYWCDYLDLTWKRVWAGSEQERLYATDRILREIDAGVIPPEKGIALIAELEQLKNSNEWSATQTKIVSERLDLQKEALKPTPKGDSEVPGSQPTKSKQGDKQ